MLKLRSNDYLSEFMFSHFGLFYELIYNSLKNCVGFQLLRDLR